MLKIIISHILKLGIAGGLIYWLITSGKLDFSLILKVLEQPITLIMIIIFMLSDHAIVAIRWRMILHTKSKLLIPYLRVFKATWIGIFFNSVLPGSVSGDLIKIFYVQDKKQQNKMSKQFLLVSVFLDRIMGLFGLITLGGIVCIVYYNDLIKLGTNTEKLVHTNLILFLVVILSLTFLFFFKDLPLKLSAWAKKIKIDFLHKILGKLEEIWNDLCLIRDKIIPILVLSTLIQGIAALIFWILVNPFASSAIPIEHAMSILPIGLIIIALPIAPAGIGVGHVAFHTLFSYIGITNGASLFNLYFVLIVMTNLTGSIPYLLSGTKRKI